LVKYQSAQRFERRDGFQKCWIRASSLEAAVLDYIESVRHRIPSINPAAVGQSDKAKHKPSG
jgi:hypothetical protein